MLPFSYSVPSGIMGSGRKHSTTWADAVVALSINIHGQTQLNGVFCFHILKILIITDVFIICTEIQQCHQQCEMK